MRKKNGKIVSLLICVMMIAIAFLTQIPTIQKPTTIESDKVSSEVNEDHFIGVPQARGTRANENGTIFNGATSSNYLGGGSYWCAGLKFEVNITCTLDRLGVYRAYYPYEFYNLRLWTGSGSLLREVSNPSAPAYSWAWFDIAPLTLSPGVYVISAGMRGYYNYIIGSVDNPGPTVDGIIEPTHYMHSSNVNAFPSSTGGTSPLPLVDIRYYTGTPPPPPPPPPTPDIIVPDNYTTIQEAIDAADPGEWIFVRESPTPYEEELIINKPIDLIGENRKTTIISASSVVAGSGYTVHITGEFVNLGGFTITGGDCGVFLDYSNNCTIFGNTIKENNNYGIFMGNSDNDHIKYNDIFSNNADDDREGFGIFAQDSYAKGVGNNYIHHNIIGVKLINSWLWGCLNWNTIYDNDIGVDYDPEPLEIDGNMFINNRIAIKISGDDSPIEITNNTIIGSQYGIYIETGSPLIEGNTFENNTYAIYYLNESAPYITNNSFRNNLVDVYHFIWVLIDINPVTLNLKSKGRWMTCYVELPGDLDANEIDISTLKISKINDYSVDIPVESRPMDIEDHDGDGIFELMVKFDRSEVQDAVILGENALTLTGQLNDGSELSGSDSIIVKNPS